jgi:hypothetical protein
MRYFFSLICVSLVFFGFADAAVLTISSPVSSLERGEAVELAIGIDTQGEMVHGVGAYVEYPADKLKYVSVQNNDEDSVFDLFSQEEISEGSVRINAVSASPGFSGAHRIATVTFVSKTAGIAEVTFSPESLALRDSDGINILSGRGAATVTIGGTPALPAVSSPPVPSPTPSARNSSLSESLRAEQMTAHSAVIVWNTETESASRVTYNTETLWVGTMTKAHRVRLDNLEPNTLYTVTVNGNEGSLQFTTLPTGDTGGEFVSYVVPEEKGTLQSVIDRVPQGLIVAFVFLAMVVGAAFFLIIRIKNSGKK